MKLNFQVADIESSQILDSKTASVSLNPVILHVLSRDLYQKHIESPFREVLINAIDAHIEAGTQRPVEIHLPTVWDELFCIRDYGPGLSHQDFMDIYLDYGNSTRRGDDDRHGGLGLGTKSPLAYTNSFLVSSFLNGEKRNYIIYYNEDNMPQVSLLDIEDTEEPNGLKVSFTTTGPSDYYQFQQSAKKLLSRIPKDKWTIVNNGELGLSLQPNDFEFPKYNQYGKIRLFPKTDESLRVQMGYVSYKLEANTVLEFLAKKKDLSFKVNQDNGVTQLFSAHEIIDNLTKSFCLEVVSDIGVYPVHPSREYVNITPKTVSQLITDVQTGLNELFDSDEISISNDIEKYKLANLVVNYSGVKVKAKYWAKENIWQNYAYATNQTAFYPDLIKTIAGSTKTTFKVALLPSNDFLDYMEGNRGRHYYFPKSFPSDNYGLLIVDQDNTDSVILDLLKEYETIDLSEEVEDYRKERNTPIAPRIKYPRNIVKSLQEPKHNVQILKAGYYGESKHAWESAEHNVESLKALKKKIFWVPTYNGNVLKDPQAAEVLKKYNQYRKYFPSWKEPLVIGLPASKGTKAIEKEFSPVSELEKYINDWISGPYVSKRVLLALASSYIHEHIVIRDTSPLLKYGTFNWLYRVTNMRSCREVSYDFFDFPIKLPSLWENILAAKIKDVAVKFPKEVLDGYSFYRMEKSYVPSLLETWVDEVVQFTNNKPTGAKSKNA